MMEMLSYEFMQRAFLAGLIVALLCPLVGMFVVIRRQSLLGDGLGHIAFAGVTGSALLGINPAIGAVVLTLAAAGVVFLRRFGVGSRVQLARADPEYQFDELSLRQYFNG